MEKDNIEKFTKNINNMSSDTVFGMLFVEIIISVIIHFFSYNQKKSIFYVIPMIIVSIVVGICYAALGKRKEKLKNIYLFLGIIGVLTSITCQIGCFLLSDLTVKQKIVLALILLVLSVVMYISVVVITKIMILKTEKLPTSLKVSRALVASGALLGTATSYVLTKSYKNSIIILCLAILSFCFIFFSIYFSKYYYIRKIEKRRQGTVLCLGSKTGDGSMC